MKILSQMYPWTRKSPLNFGSNPDLQSRSGLRIPIRFFLVEVSLTALVHDVQGGKLFFMEHVYAKRGTLRRFQWFMRSLWSAVIYSCDLCRETDLYIRAAVFRDVDMEEFEAVELTHPNSIMPGIPGIVLMRPHISGTATK